MFSSNVGFRRRTVSEGYNQLLPPPSSKRTTSASHRHSLDESSSTTIKRIVLRKHSGESTGSRGLADRIARSEVENINGFWSRRLSGQRRSVPASPKQAEPNLSEWRREAQENAHTSSNVAERGQAYSKPRGPRPLSKVQVTSPSQTTSYLVPSGILSPSSTHASSKITQPSLLVPADPAVRTETVCPTKLPASTSQSLTKAKSDNGRSAAVRTRDPGLSYRPLLPPGLPILKKTTRRDTPKSATQNKAAMTEKEKEKEKDKRRFAHLEFTLGKLVRGRKVVSNQNQSTALTVYNEKHRDALVPPSLPTILPNSIPISLIPIPPIPYSETPAVHTSRVSRPRSVKSVKSVKSTKSGKSASRRSSRKRKTGLARIVVELAKGEKIVAVDAEAIQEAAEVRDILAQLRQMKAT